jgi:hypothetical protein
MSGSDRKEQAPRPPDPAEKMAEVNRNVDVGQVREAQALLEELRRQGLARPEYEIASPYERRPVRLRRSNQRTAA